MDGLSDLEEIEIALYLFHNSSYHCSITPHSWPCGVWLGQTAPKRWKDLFEHGLIPRNWRVLTEDPSMGSFYE